MKSIKKNLILVVMMFALSLVLISCNNSESTANKEADVESTTPTADEDGNIEVNVNIKDSTFHGTMSKKWKREEPSNKDKKNIQQVKEAFEAFKIEDDNIHYECIYGDIESELSVWCLITGKDNKPLDNFGIIVRNNGKNFEFADLEHGKNPTADYDEKAKKLFIACDVIEGTGTHAEVLYAFDIKKNEVTNIALLDPYDVQLYFMDNMTYDVKQNDISFKLRNKVISQMVNHEDGYGTLRALAVGEQIAYEFDEKHNIKVNVTPGIKFGPGVNLFYEETPTFSAEVKLKGNKFALSNIKLAEE